MTCFGLVTVGLVRKKSWSPGTRSELGPQRVKEQTRGGQLRGRGDRKEDPGWSDTNYSGQKHQGRRRGTTCIWWCGAPKAEPTTSPDVATRTPPPPLAPTLHSPLPRPPPQIRHLPASSLTALMRNAFLFDQQQQQASSSAAHGSGSGSGSSSSAAALVQGGAPRLRAPVGGGLGGGGGHQHQHGARA